MTTMNQEPPLPDEVKERLKLIDRFGSEAAAAHLSGKFHEAATKRVLLNVQSELIGDLLS